MRSKSPWKAYVLLFLLLISTVSQVKASGDLKVGGGGTINNTGTIRIKNQAIGLPAVNGGLYEFFGSNQIIPARQYQSVKLSGAGAIKSNEGDMTVNGTLTIMPTILQETGGSTVYLPGSIDEQGYLQGNLDKTDNLIGATGSSNFGNMGLTLSWNGTAPGSTKVVRTTGNAVTSAATGKQSIKRYFDITPTVNTGLNGTVVFQYDAGELNGQNANTLTLWRSADGGATWRNQGGTVDVGARTITKTGVLSFSRWTASDASNPLGTAQLEWVAQNIASTAGTGQTALAGTTLSPYVVTITDGYGNPMSGIPVTFAITTVPTGATGQNLTVTSATTGSSGQASTVLTLGNVSGAYTVTVTSAGLIGSPLTFSSTATTTSVATMLTMASGNGQSGVVKTTLGSPLVVTVLDQFSAPMPGVTVKYALTSIPAGATGQALADTSVVTNSSGQAQTTLKLGDKIGTYVVSASSGSLTGSPMRFNATATAGSAVTLAVISGNNQSGPVTTQLANPFVVSVVDSFGNPTAGRNVRFALSMVPSGALTQQLGDTLVVTNALGLASTGLKFGTKAGVYTVTATSDDVPLIVRTFNATAHAAAPMNVSLPSGAILSGQVGTTLSPAYVVAVTDTFGNPIIGSNVRLAMTSSPTGAVGQSPKDTTIVTDSLGRTSIPVSIGTKAGAYVLTVTTGSLTRQITINASAGAVSTVAVGSGSGQTGLVGTSLGQPMVVVATDVYGNVVSGVNVTFAISQAPAGATGQGLSVASMMTGVTGLASTQLTLGNKAGQYEVAALVNGLPAVVFTATATTIALVATKLVQTSGNAQSGVAGTHLASPFVVTVLDQFGNPFVGATVTFAITGSPSGDTSAVVTTTTAVTDTGGRAMTLLKLGTKAGTYTVTASSGSLTGSPITFTATATAVAAVATRLVQTSGNAQSGVAGTQLARPMVVTVLDQFGNPFAGATVTFTITGSPSGDTSAALSVATAVTDTGGRASTLLMLGTNAGTYTVTASSPSLTGSPVTFTATAAPVAAVATRLVQTSGNGQSATVGTQLSSPIVVTVLDQFGSPFAGATVTFAIATVPLGDTSAFLTVTTAVTDASGLASTQLKLGTKAGSYTVVASSPNLTGSPVTFTATATAIASIATRLVQTSGNNQSARVRTQLADAFVVTVLDQFGNPFAGATVNFAIASAPLGDTSAFLTSLSQTTNASGQASVKLNVGARVGVYTVNATSASLAGSPVTFSATALSGLAARMLYVAGNGQTGPTHSPLAQPFIVRVTDADGNTVAKASVRFTVVGSPVSASGFSLDVLDALTDSLGLASSRLTLGDRVGSYVVNAGSTLMPGVTVGFTARATAGSPQSLVLVSGDAQRGLVGTTLQQPFVASTLDVDGNPVPGVGVQFAIETAPIGATGHALSRTTVVTDSLGRASTLMTLGNVTGEYTVTSSSTGLSGGRPVFRATATLASGAVSIAYTSGNAQSASVLAQLANPLVATVLGVNGTPVSGQPVTFAIDSLPGGATGQALSTSSATTDAQGRATTTLTLGNKIGVYRVVAAVAGLSGSPVTYRLTSTVGLPKTLALMQGNGQTKSIGTILDNAYVVRVLDVASNPVPGVAVQFTLDTIPNGSTGQSLRVVNSLTDAQGQAQAVLTLGSKVGNYVVSASSAGLEGSPVRFIARATVGSPSAMAMTSGSEQTAYISTELAAPLVVAVSDNGGNAVQGVNVQFAIETTPSGSRGQALRIINSVTGAQGQASVVLRLGDQVGRYTVTATAAGLPTVRFGATATVLVGDVNGDYAINIADLTTVIDYILGKITLTGSDSAKADFNKDGHIDIRDVAAMQSHLLSIDASGSQPLASKVPGLSSDAKTSETVTDSTSTIGGEFLLTENGLRFNLTNTVPVKGLQLIIRFKDAQKILKPDVVFDRAKVDSFYVNSSGQELRIVAYNLGNAPIAVGSGPLFRLPVKLADVSGIEAGQLILSLANNVAFFDQALTRSVPARLATSQDVPLTFVLYQNYPNPFNGQTKIDYEVIDGAGMMEVSIQVFNVLGEKVKALVTERRSGGRYTAMWDGTDDNGTKLSSGTYYYRMISGTYVSSKKMIMLK